MAKHDLSFVSAGPDALNDVNVGPMRDDERDAALGVLLRGMASNPVHIAVAGDENASGRMLGLLFGGALHQLGWERHMLVARTPDGMIVGVCGILPPGMCQPTMRQRVRLGAGLFGLGPFRLIRLLRWTRAWANLDPAHPHWHLGPVAVEPGWQGEGIGSRMLHVVSERMDALKAAVYLETDKQTNVRFYRRFGFEVVKEADVLGVRTWFMWRRPG